MSSRSALRHWSLLLLLCAAPLCVRAQNGQVAVPPRFTVQQPPQQTGYTVTGRVVCADTQRAARFAQVMLVPATNGTSDFERGRMAVGRTDLDGRFTIDNVPPGEYFGTAELTGYINDAPAVRNALNQGGDALNAVSTVPRVQVSNGGGSLQLSLQRGAVVAGSVQWDDGSPASGVSVMVQPAPANGVSTGVATASIGGGFGRGFFPGFGNGGQTDDRGHFRLSGLAPGNYVLRATVQSPLPSGGGGGGGGDGRFQRLMSLSVFAPNKLRSTEATVITLSPGEERSDVNVVLGLSGMHTVSGEVSSSAAAVRSGSVQLTDQNDSTLNRRGIINPDGSFSVPYVPPGTYTLRVNASAQQQVPGRGGSPQDATATRFQPFQESITVTDNDLSGLAVTVNTATASQ